MTDSVNTFTKPLAQKVKKTRQFQVNTIKFSCDNDKEKMLRYLTETILSFFQRLHDNAKEQSKDHFFKPDLTNVMRGYLTSLKNYSPESIRMLGTQLMKHLRETHPSFDLERCLNTFVMAEVISQTNAIDSRLALSIEREHMHNFLHGCVKGAAARFQHDPQVIMKLNDIRMDSLREQICEKSILNQITDFQTVHADRVMVEPKVIDSVQVADTKKTTASTTNETSNLNIFDSKSDNSAKHMDVQPVPILQVASNNSNYNQDNLNQMPNITQPASVFPTPAAAPVLSDNNPIDNMQKSGIIKSADPNVDTIVTSRADNYDNTDNYNGSKSERSKYDNDESQRRRDDPYESNRSDKYYDDRDKYRDDYERDNDRSSRYPDQEKNEPYGMRSFNTTTNEDSRYGDARQDKEVDEFSKFLKEHRITSEDDADQQRDKNSRYEASSSFKGDDIRSRFSIS